MAATSSSSSTSSFPMASIIPTMEEPSDPPTPATAVPTQATAVNISTAVQKKRKRFHFIETYDVFLLRTVRAANAHIPEHGQSDPLYKEIMKTFLEQVPLVVFKHLHEQSYETLADRFKKIVAQRRKAFQKTGKASGIIEKHGDKDVLLDDLIRDIDEKEEGMRADKDEQTENEKRLVAAGEAIRGMVLKRTATDANDVQSSDAPSSAKKKQQYAREGYISYDELVSSILSKGEELRSMEPQCLVLDKRRFELELQKTKKEEERFEAMQTAQNRRLDLEEKRFELDKKERKQAMEERNQMVGII